MTADGTDDRLRAAIEDGERVRWSGRPDRVVALLSRAVVALLAGPLLGVLAGPLLAVPVALLTGGPVPLAGGATVGAVVMPLAVILAGLPGIVVQPVYAVTDRRVLVVDGGLSGGTTAVPLAAVEDVSVDVGRAERFLEVGTGTVVVATAAGRSDVRFSRVVDPEGVAAEVAALLPDRPARH